MADTAFGEIKLLKTNKKNPNRNRKNSPHTQNPWVKYKDYFEMHIWNHMHLENEWYQHN